ncbi:MAG: Type II secretory pathway, pseudopilin PulG [Verrucomicrobia bacterium]|nr:MAG: Type II secretory pathway, pseudopilin PulG [Verrucomicrobiota bacterium]
MTVRSRHSAFSLLEILLAVAIIGTLAAVAVVRHHNSIENVRVAKLESDIATINSAIKTYAANGGSLAGIVTPQAVLDKMKTSLSTEEDARFVGIGGSMIDARLTAVSSDDLPDGKPRAIWNSVASRFDLATNGSGIAQFVLDATAGRAEYGTESREDGVTFSYNTSNGWVWNYNDAAPLPRPTPSLVSVSGLPSGTSNTVDPTPWSDPLLSNLLPPTFSLDGGSYRPSRFPLEVQLINPNPAASSTILVSVGGSNFVPYTAPLKLVADTTVTAFATGDPSLWFPSSTVGETYLVSPPEQLATPVISPSSPQFQWDTAETISVSISNPNSSDDSALDYKIDDGSWSRYSGSFSLEFSANEDGAVISARVIPLGPDYTESQVATVSIAPAPPQQNLVAPVITTSQPKFIQGSVETITVTLADQNAAGSALEYRLQGGNWLTYASSFNVTRAAYPQGVKIEARSRAISRAYINSTTSSFTVELSTVELRPPNIIPTAANFIVGAVETVNVTITNPNPTSAASLLDYKINNGAWLPYTTALSFTRANYSSGFTIAARARSTSAGYTNSVDSSVQIGVTGIPLLPPSITPSAPNFVAGNVETVTVTLTNLNSVASSVSYRLNGGTWLNYSGVFSVTRSTYPSGVLVEARVAGTTTASATSAINSVSIGLATLQLRPPSLVPSAANFIAGVTDSISVSIVDPNTVASAAEYRIDNGAWQAYQGPFTVTLAGFPSGLMIEARARATAPTHVDSDLDTAIIGLTLAQLRRPLISTSAASLMAGAAESVSVSISNPNAVGLGEVEYRLDGGAWQTYAAPFTVSRAAYPSGATIESRVRALSLALLDSDVSTSIISLIPWRLRSPTVSSDVAGFVAGFVESATITVTATDAASEGLEYRLNGQSWQAYTAPFAVTRTNYPTGVTVEARSISSSPALDPSEIASLTIGLSPVQLQSPIIMRSATVFSTSTNTVTVSLVNPNLSGALMDYRLNNGAWQTYTVPFTLAWTNFSAGVTIDARARSISAAFLTSGIASALVGTSASELQSPVITPTAPNFIQGFQEWIAIGLSNPNPVGSSALDYRINGGEWLAYTTTITATRTAYPSGLTIEARARALSSTFTTSPNAILAIGLTSVLLRSPMIATTAPRFIAENTETVTVTLTNPNATGSVIDYRLNGGSWLTYTSSFTGTLAANPNGLTIEARCRATDSALATSTIASAFVGVAPVRLQTPLISPSASNFLAGSAESVTVTLTTPNTTGFVLEYRLANGVWVTYSTPFVVTQQSYQAGVVVEARARALTAAYVDSNIALAAIGRTPVLLRRPSIIPSANSFLPGSIESVSVTLTNPNPVGAVLEYRVNNGAWLVYSAPFTVTRTSFPNGVPIEARARALSSAYITSESSTFTVKLTPVQLIEPSIRSSASDFIPGSVETLTVTLVNPNPIGSVMDYRINGGGWTTYSTALSLRRTSYPTGVSLEARARATQSAYATSNTSTANFGVALVQLLTPTISSSDPAFVAGTTETITVSISDPNATTTTTTTNAAPMAASPLEASVNGNRSMLQYRLNGRAWVNYSAPFTVTRTLYPTGVTVEARALATTPAYLTSNNALRGIGLTTLTLQTPTLASNVRNFRIGSADFATVTVTNPNPSGISALQYRINSGGWLAYTGPVTFARTAYPSGLTVGARAVAAAISGYGTSRIGTTTIGLTQVQLLPPSITRTLPNFVAGSGETITITLSNRNPSGSALQYRLAGGGWTTYTTPFTVTRSRFPKGVIVEAQARATISAYLASTIASTNIGIGTVQLQIPVITPSAQNFMAGSTESITVTVSNPNPSGSSILQYRINGTAWRNYTGAFAVNRTSYPTGLNIEAQALTASTVYVTSAAASATIGLTPARLNQATIRRSPVNVNFMAGSVETMTISLAWRTPNPSGVSVNEYRLNGGSWLTYTSAFNVTRSAFPQGVTIDARSRSTSVAYIDSTTSTMTIGVTLVPLQTPMIRRSSPNFVPNQVDAITVTLINPNSTLTSALDYRINDGTWVPYTAPFSLTRAVYPNGCSVQARARAIVAGYDNSPNSSATISLKLNATKTTVTFTSMASTAGYLNEAYIYIDGDAYYLGNSDMGAGFAVNVDVYLETGVTNVFDLSIDTYMRSGGRFISGALRGLDTRTGSLFSRIDSNASFRGQSTNSAKIKDLSFQSNLNMIVGYEDLIIAKQNPDWDYDDFMFRLTSSQAFNFTFGGYAR